jgi:D-3-phosphoglycerate dehydrogenase
LSKFTVLATDGVSTLGLAPLREDDRFDVVVIADSTRADFDEALSVASGLIVRSATKVREPMFERAPLLKVVGRAGVGVDNIDLNTASERGIAVMNAPAGNTVSAAELTMALILSAARWVPEADRSIRDGKWERARLRGMELRGKLLGLIGAGRIGSEVAARCRAFGMDVIAYDPFLTQERAHELRLNLVGLDDVLKKADVISLHVPLTDETRGLIGESSLEKMKNDVLVVNASRGGVIDETALAAALVNGSIAGAALDVYETEPIPTDSPLRDAPNLILTPHLGASTREAQIHVAREVAEAIIAVLAHGDVSGAVNASEISGATGLS